MILHLGGDVIVPIKDIIAIIDYETVAAKDTNEFLKIAEEEGFIRRITDEPPKSFIIAEINKKSVIFFSPISSTTLLKRSSYIDEMEI